MSEVKETDTSCASCGIAEIDDIKLKECDNCDLVRYCCDTCRDDHKSEHEAACKIRAAELRDELLFKTPEGSHLGDCPICFLPLSLDQTKSRIFSCCSKMICFGCVVANKEASLNNQSCPFCRKPISEIEVERKKLTLKRVKANDPFAMIDQATDEYKQGNYDASFEWFSKAAELGDASAHYRLAVMYQDGEGVAKDKEKEIYHMKEAAIGGHPDARHYLGCTDDGNIERGLKHLLIAAGQGLDESITMLMELYKKGQGYVSKEDLTTALRAHQAAVDATKSPQREAAEGQNTISSEE